MSVTLALTQPLQEMRFAFLTNSANYETNDSYTARQAAWSIRAVGGDLGLPDADRLFLSAGSDPLSLTLPSGPDRSVIDNLNRWLPAAGHYDPAWFRGELKRIRRDIGIQ